MRAKQKGNNMLRQVIYGPPGTGKSTEIIKRAEFYTEKYDKDKIALCSYTKAAAQVLAKRCGIKSKYIGTLHSLAYKVAGIIREQVVDNTKLRAFFNEIGIPFSGNSVNEDKVLFDGDYYLSMHYKAVAECKDDIDKLNMPGSFAEYEYFTEAYSIWKNANGYVDYNDMLQLAIQQESLDVDVIFIDEAQDLSKLQWNLIEHWTSRIPNIIIAGDDDQAIYEWAGACPQGMSNFEKTYKADRVVLNQSYRIPNKVHKIAEDITKNIKNRVDKVYMPRDYDGIVHHYIDFDQITEIKHNDDILILYRNHSMLKAIENYLVKNHLPYVTDNGPKGLCQGFLWKLIKTYKKLQQSKNYTLTKTQHKLLARGLQERYRNMLGTDDEYKIFEEPWQNTININIEDQIYFEALEKHNCMFEIEPTIHLSSIHGAKGREAERVILLNSLGEMTADAYYQNENHEMEQEARVFYVAVTRAKKRLDIVLGDNALSFL